RRAEPAREPLALGCEQRAGRGQRTSARLARRGLERREQCRALRQLVQERRRAGARGEGELERVAQTPGGILAAVLIEFIRELALDVRDASASAERPEVGRDRVRALARSAQEVARAL